MAQAPAADEKRRVGWHHVLGAPERLPLAPRAQSIAKTGGTFVLQSAQLCAESFRDLASASAPRPLVLELVDTPEETHVDCLRSLERPIVLTLCGGDYDRKNESCSPELSLRHLSKAQQRIVGLNFHTRPPGQMEGLSPSTDWLVQLRAFKRLTHLRLRGSEDYEGVSLKYWGQLCREHELEYIDVGARLSSDFSGERPLASCFTTHLRGIHIDALFTEDIKGACNLRQAWIETRVGETDPRGLLANPDMREEDVELAQRLQMLPPDQGVASLLEKCPDLEYLDLGDEVVALPKTP